MTIVGFTFGVLIAILSISIGWFAGRGYEREIWAQACERKRKELE